MEKPILTLTTKDFLTGIAPSAHTERGGLFFTATGVTPIYDPGGSASVENGLLQAGPAPTNFSASVVVDTPFASVTGYSGSTPYLFLLGNSGHLYRKPLGSGDPVDLRSGTPITNPANGITIWGPAGGTNLLYFWQKTQIGTWDRSGSHPTGWTDNAYTGLTSLAYHPVHQFNGNVYYGNGAKVGALTDAGSATVSHSTNVLDLPANQGILALSDDGVYLVIAATENLEGTNNFALNSIYFWDTFSSSWSRSYEIRDPFIWALKRIGFNIYAFGQYGIYEVSFGGGVKKVLSRLIGFGTQTDPINGFGASRAAVYNQQALIFATDTTIDTFGPLSPDLPSAYYKSFKVPSGVGTPSLVDPLFDVGRVYVGVDGNKLYGYDFNAATRETSVSAQTVYIPFKTKTSIKRIDVLFGEPLASGDAFDLDTKTDEDTSAVDFGAASFTADGAVRRKSLFPNKAPTVEGQLSFILNWTGGAVKLKRIEVYGDAMTP